MDVKEQYIWDANEWLYLRQHLKIVPTLNGCIYSFPRQEEFKGLPATLLPEEQIILKDFHAKYETAFLKISGKMDTTDNKHFSEYLFTEEQQDENQGDDICKSLELRGHSLSPFALIKCNVFIDLHKRGYYITCGSKFGGDFLAYPNDPVKFHSHYIVICLPWDTTFPALKLVTFGRISSATKKTVLLSTLSPENKVVYQSLRWKNEADNTGIED